MVLHFVLKQITHALNVKFEAAVLKNKQKKTCFIKYSYYADILCFYTTTQYL